ncbi:MAG TPA: ferredoxin family protein [Planctomycetota bacterium]|nr:ferredoxin family protein [Planctomycetota bacterium]
MNDNFHVVTSACIGTKDTACARVCPVSCFYDAGEMLMIHPGECIGCGLCVPECPVSAILPHEEVPENEHEYIGRAERFFAELPQAQAEAIRVNP